MARVPTYGKRSIRRHDNATTGSLIKKEGGRRPPSKMARVATDDKRSIQRQAKALTRRLMPPFKMARYHHMVREASEDKTKPQQADSLNKKVAEGHLLRI